REPSSFAQLRRVRLAPSQRLRHSPRNRRLDAAELLAGLPELALGLARPLDPRIHEALRLARALNPSANMALRLEQPVRQLVRLEHPGHHPDLGELLGCRAADGDRIELPARGA